MASLASVDVIEFGLYGDEDHRMLSNAVITSNNMNPTHGGICDPKLGTTDYEYRCETCFKNKPHCPGHPGFLELNCPLIQPIAIAEVRRWLKVVCHTCGRLMVDPIKYAKSAPLGRLGEASQSVTDGKMCLFEDCKAIHPKIVQDKTDNFTFIIQDAEGQQSKLYSFQIAKIFDRIRDKDVIALGKSLENHPRKLILSGGIQIPPVSVRPTIKSSLQFLGGANNDINGILAHLVTRNKSIKEEDILRGQVDEDLDKTINVFQQFYYEMIQGSTTVSMASSTGKRTILAGGSKQITSFMKTQSRKQGRIRSNLLRKKVSDICRQTISGNSQIKPDHLIIPISFARTLRVFEHVQEFNKDYLMTFFLNGSSRYPGCSRIHKKSDNRLYSIENLRKDITLEVGDILERDVITGDVCIFNRQPSLEICSMGCHTVVVNEDPAQRTIQMNVLACSNYNADFDGDEMNCFVPKDPMTRAEVKNVSYVDKFFISTKNSRPQNGQVQDSNIGSALMTMRGDPDVPEIQMNKFHAMCMFAIPDFKLPQIEDGKLYTGREVMSMLLKRTPINFVGKPTFYNDNFVAYMKYDPSDTKTVIRNGEMIQGVLDKKSVGPKAGRGVFHIISQNYGNMEALNAIYNMQQVVLSFLQYYGFTVSTSDIMLPESVRDQIQELIQQVIIESQVINDELMEGKITPPITMTTHEFYEKKQINALKIKDDDLLRVMMTNISPHRNSFFQMIATGSKGIIPNMIHIMACLQQITINGERIRSNFGHSRTLPYFGKFTTDPEAYGFIKNSYIMGMNVSEFIFASMHGRFDLINKALSTSSTGHHFRKSYMSMQSIVIDYFRRAAMSNRIIQFMYGDDGLDARGTEKVDFFSLSIGDSELRERITPTTTSKQAEEMIKMIIQDRDTLRKVFLDMENSHFNRLSEVYLSTPVNVDSIWNQVIGNRTRVPTKAELGNLDAKIKNLLAFCRQLKYIYFNSKLKEMDFELPEYVNMATHQVQILIRLYLSPKVIEKTTQAELEVILGLIEKRYSNNLVQYGDLASAKAAQGECEPLTQNFLDSHTKSVGSATSKGSLNEIKRIFSSDLDIEKDSNTTSMLLRIADPKKRFDKDAVQDIANRIEHIDLNRFVVSQSILFEAFDDLRYPPFKEDNKWIDDFKKTNPLLTVPADLTSWCMRFELSKIMLVLKNISLDNIIEALSFDSNVFVVSTKESHEKIFIRVWLLASAFAKKAVSDEAKVFAIKEQLLSTQVRGIKGVYNVAVKKIIRHRVNPDGSMQVKSDEYAIETQGGKISDILLCEDIDKTNIMSTSIRDTMHVFGIEAARQKIITETMRFMDDNVPNERHIKMYADLMTVTGSITSIERKGMSIREPLNVLGRAAYCAPSQVFTDAALNNLKGPVDGMAAKRLIGQTPVLGTLYSKINIDHDFVRENALNINTIMNDLEQTDFAFQ